MRPLPKTKGDPLLLAAEGPRGGVVVACCAQAIGQGISPQMPVAEAKSLVPQVKIVKYDPAADRQALADLAAACEQFSPCVAIEEGDSPECLLLDISNLEHLWGSEAKLAARVQAFFVERGWRVRVAVAGTVGVAWGMAHFEDQDRKRGRREEGEIDWQPVSSPCLPLSPSPTLSSLPIEALRIADGTAALLRQLGVETVSQLLALPREELSSRFGEQLLLRIGQWEGTVAELLTPHRPPGPLVASYSLEQSTGDMGLLTHVLRELVGQLAGQLRIRDEGAIVLTCTLTCVNRQTVPLSIGLFTPSACPQQLMELVSLHLEAVRLPDEVVRIELRAATTARLSERQRELFADRWTSDPHQLALLVNRLSSRLGDEQVLRAELRESPLPERAVRWTAVIETKKTMRGGDKSQIRRGGETRRRTNRRQQPTPCLPVFLSPCLAPPRPLLLYPQPQQIEVTSIAPEGPPQIVWLGDRRERVARHWGPERIETLWWRGRTVRRDYYRVATDTGSHLWIFQPIAQKGWFLHGVFC